MLKEKQRRMRQRKRIRRPDKMSEELQCLTSWLIYIFTKRDQSIIYHFIYKNNLVKTTTYFGFYFLRPSSGRKYPYVKETVQSI
jgi:hypothetical protein